MEFVRPPLPGRVVFAVGAVGRLPELSRELGLKRLLLIGASSAEAHLDAARGLLDGEAVDVVGGARAHVPTGDVHLVVDRAMIHRADGLVALGGGSAIGLAKAAAVATGLPVIAVPTTYAGSEMTAVYGTSEAGRKQVQRDPAAAPRVVIYDPQLTVDLPRSVTVETGINAAAHCVEALYAPDADPAMGLIARNGLGELVGGLPEAVRAPGDAAARERVLLGAYQAGLALATCGMGVHHRICHVLGGATLAPHGKLNAAVLPHVVALNAGHAPTMRAALADSLGRSDIAAGLWAWIAELGGPLDLAAAAADGADLDEIAAHVVDPPLANPAPLSREVVRELLDRVHHGAPPQALVEYHPERSEDDATHD